MKIIFIEGGKIWVSVRIGPRLTCRLRQLAEARGVSLEQFIKETLLAAAKQ